MKKFVGLLTFSFVLMFCLRAEAQQVLSFDESSPTRSPALLSVVCADTTGFRFLSGHFHLVGPVSEDIPNASSNGTSHLGYESGRGLPITMERVGGGTFSLLSLDVGEFYSAPNERPDAETLTITGTRQGGETVSYSLTIDGIRDGAGGVDDFQHFVLPNTFVNLTSVVFTGLRAGGLDGGVAIDNLEYQLASPEVLPACVATPIPPETPTVTITSPAAGYVAGTVSVAATATDNIGVASVQFRVDGIDLGAPDVTAPYAIAWDTTTVPDGSYTISAEVRDGSNNSAVSSVLVTVRNHDVGNEAPHYVDLDGVNDYVQVGDTDALSFGNGVVDRPFTMELWVRPDAMTRHQLLGKWGSNTTSEYRLHIASGFIRMDLKDGSANATVSVYTSASQTALIGGWHHVAVTYDGRGGANAATGLAIYIDGVAVPVTRSNSAAYVAMENTASTLQIGRESPSWQQFDGALDEIRVWNLARTASEIQSTMTTEVGSGEPGLVAAWRFNEGSGITAADTALPGNAATLFNGAAWMSGGPLAPTTPDVTPPALMNIGVNNVGESSATVTFTTSEPATGWVSYTATGVCPCTDVYSAAQGTSHVVTLTGLTPATTYQVVVKASDAAGNLQTSTPMSVTTLPPQPDTTAPLVTLVRPTGTVSGTVLVEATATDNRGVVSVQFLVDGVALGAPDTVAPYVMSLDTTTLSEGPHTITAEARDAANNAGTVSGAITVRNLVSLTPHYVDLDGTNDYVQVADADALSFGNGVADSPFTMELWVRPDAMVRHQLLGKWGSSTTSEYRLHIASGYIRMDLKDGSANATVSVYTLASQTALIGGWHHVAVTYDGRGGANAATGLAIYIDGVAVPVTRSNSAAYVAMENTTGSLQIGRESPSWQQFDGALDEIRVWNLARTASQIQSTMMVEVGSGEPGLVAAWSFNEGSGVTAADASGSGNAATLFNGAAWVAGGPLAPSTPDVTPPALTNIAVGNVGESSATVTFTTSEPATAWVSYTATGACPCTDVYSAGPGTSHIVALTGLAAATTYQVVVKASDAAGNLQTATPINLTTLAPQPDTTAPTVTLVRPAGTVTGTVQVEATATDNRGVVSVQFLVDGVALGAADTVAPYVVSLDTTTLAEGPHTITAEARDAANNVGTASGSVTVRNLVTVTPHYVDLDGSNDYVQVSDANALSFGNGAADSPFTMELWVRPDAMVRHQLLGKWGSSTTSEYRLHIASGFIRMDLKDGSANATVSVYTSASQTTLIGSWHHVAVTYDGRGGANAAAGLAIYVDGVAVPVTRINNAAYVAMENTTGSLQIGRESPSWQQFDGALDEIRMWNVARTASQIQSTMATEVGGGEAGLVAAWQFNEGSGVTVTDAAGAGNAATLFNGTAWIAGGPLQ